MSIKTNFFVVGKNKWWVHFLNRNYRSDNAVLFVHIGSCDPNHCDEKFEHCQQSIFFLYIMKLCFRLTTCFQLKHISITQEQNVLLSKCIACCFDKMVCHLWTWLAPGYVVYIICKIGIWIQATGYCFFRIRRCLLIEDITLKGASKMKELFSEVVTRKRHDLICCTLLVLFRRKIHARVFQSPSKEIIFLKTVPVEFFRNRILLVSTQE